MCARASLVSVIGVCAREYIRGRRVQSAEDALVARIQSLRDVQFDPIVCQQTGCRIVDPVTFKPTMGNGKCDEKCDTEQCLFDDGDCVDAQACAATGCDFSSRASFSEERYADGECDAKCDNKVRRGVCH